MKALVILLSVVFLAACGEGYKTGSKAAANSTAGGNTGGGDPDPDPVITPELQLNAAQADLVGDVLSQITSNLFFHLSGLGGGFSTGQKNLTMTLTCPQGGNVVVTAQATVGLTGTDPLTAALTNGGASVAFNNCILLSQGALVNFAGTLTISAVQASVTADMDLAAGTGTYTGTGQGNSNGNLTLSVGGQNATCAVTTTGNVTSSGNITTAGGFDATGTVSGQVAGTACGFNISRTLAITF